MSDYKRWRVTGPNGFEWETPETALDEIDILGAATNHVGLDGLVSALRAAGYRAEPFEEPKMVTVRAEDIQEAIDMIGAGLMWASHHPTSPYLSTAEYNKDSAYGRARNVRSRLRAALDGAK